MFFQFCDLCRKTTKVQSVILQRFYRKASKSKYKHVRKHPDIPKAIKEQTPIISCKRKEFNFYEGQTYSKHIPIPLASKGWHHYKSKEDYFFIHPLTDVEEKEVNCESKEEYDTFAHFGLNPELVRILERYDIKKPMDIQIRGLPVIMSGANTVIAAETGCGKTLTYLLPMIDNIYRWKKLTDKRYNSPLGLIVTPTRELAFQIGLEATKICQYLDIETKTLTGGKTKKMMLNPSVSEVDIVIASFGVISKLTTTTIYKLDMVRSIVLDEADALFHETFEEKLKVFLKRVPLGFMQNNDDTQLPIAAQFTLASATMPSRMSKVLNNIINVDSLVNVTSNKLHRIIVPQKFIRVGPDDKPEELLKYIKPKVAQKEQVIIFTNKSTTCNWVSQFLEACNIQTACLHGSLPFYVRSNKYATFKSGRCQVLCTTNAGSRGLDTIRVRHVLNYEFPTATADYIHRCGRTGRVGNTKDCRVTNFISTKQDIAVVKKIEIAVRKMKPIPIFDINETDEDKDDGLVFEPETYEEENVQEEFSIPY